MSIESDRESRRRGSRPWHESSAVTKFVPSHPCHRRRPCDRPTPLRQARRVNFGPAASSKYRLTRRHKCGKPLNIRRQCTRCGRGVPMAPGKSQRNANAIAPRFAGRSAGYRQHRPHDCEQGDPPAMQQVMNDGMTNLGREVPKRTTNNIVEAVPRLFKSPFLGSPRARSHSCQSLVHLSSCGIVAFGSVGVHSGGGRSCPVHAGRCLGRSSTRPSSSLFF